MNLHGKKVPNYLTNQKKINSKIEQLFNLLCLIGTINKFILEEKLPEESSCPEKKKLGEILLQVRKA